MATSGDSSPLNQLLGRIMQTIRSVQQSVDGGVDSNILQRNISIIEAVQIQLVRIETLFSDHESRVLYDQLQTEVQKPGFSSMFRLIYLARWTRAACSDPGKHVLDNPMHVTSFPLHFCRGRVTELCRVPINSNYAVYLFLAIYVAA